MPIAGTVKVAIPTVRTDIGFAVGGVAIEHEIRDAIPHFVLDGGKVHRDLRSRRGQRFSVFIKGSQSRPHHRISWEGRLVVSLCDHLPFRYFAGELPLTFPQPRECGRLSVL